MAPNNQLYDPIDVKHDCDTNNIGWKGKMMRKMQMLKSYLNRFVPPCTMGMEPP